MADALRVLEAEVTNIKRIRAVHIAPPRHYVVIGGDNGQGKTSLLDSIQWALGDQRKVQSKPIRKGEERGEVVVILGDDDGPRLKVRRRYIRQPDDSYTQTLLVESPDGGRFKQAKLDELAGPLWYDPLAFVDKDPQEQARIIRSFVPGFDFLLKEGERKKLFDARTDTNRDAKREKAVLDDMPVDPAAPQERIDTAPIIAELRAVGDTVRDIAYMRDSRRRSDEHRANLLADAERKEAQAAELEAQAKALREEAKLNRDTHAERTKAAAKLDPIPDEPDASEIETRLREANDANLLFDAAVRRTEQEKRLQARTDAADALTEQIEALDAEVAKAIAEAELPVHGLTFDAGGVYLDGVPFDQASGAEQLRASMAIAIHQNPAIRVFMIREASRLDAKALPAIKDAAEYFGVQIWLEDNRTTDPEAILIEDGAVRGADTSPEPAQQEE